MDTATATPKATARATAAAAAAVTLSAKALRRLAETADGLRELHPWLVVDDDGKLIVVEQAKIGTRQRLINLETPDDGPALHFKPTLGLTVDGKTYPPGRGLELADAVFTSQSAVEKFVFPYYTRVKSPAEVEAMAREMFDDEATVAIIHFPSTRYGLLQNVTFDARTGNFDLKNVSFSKSAI
jgi:hypothetical protein